MKWSDVSIKSYAIPTGVPSLPGIKNCVLIASGKGGVGKSTTTVNIALALKQAGIRVGILDADIYGPNQPQLLGTTRRPEMLAEHRMNPVVSHGIPSMSMGYLIDSSTAMIWRGPMISQALQQLLRETAWGELDILLFDLPPGTGDIPLTLAQKIPVSGVVVVTTPQDIALADVRKALAMFQKVNVPVLGVIENMSYYRCPQCGYQDQVFGVGGGERLTREWTIPLLGQIPLDRRICAHADQGTPTVVLAPESDIALAYQQAAEQMMIALMQRPINYNAKIPPIVIESKL